MNNETPALSRVECVISKNMGGVPEQAVDSPESECQILVHIVRNWRFRC
jgi:hypothetical protein